MNTPETRTIVGKIDASVERILARININTWIFSTTAAVVLLMGIAMTVVVLRQNDTIKLAEANRKLATKANKLAIKAAGTAASNTTRQDILNKQFTDYINQTVAVWNKLQTDNASPKDVQRRGIKVPIAPIPRPPGLPLPKDGDLERITRTVTASTPRPRVIIKRVKVKPTPTPGILQRIFNPKSTR